MDNKDAISLLQSIEDGFPESIWLKLQPLIRSTYLPEIKCANERPLEEADFSNHRLVIYKNLNTIILIFKELKTQNKLEKFQLDVETVYDVVLLCGEHMKQELWTSKDILKSAQILLDTVLEFCNFECFTKLLFEYKSDFSNTLFVKLRPKLLKDTWKKYPAAVACYKWLLFQIKIPRLSDLFDTVLPTALIILDDHEFHHRITGMQCIEHIVNNVTRTELNWYGKGALIYKALEPMVYFREPELLPALTSSLIALLKKTEIDPSGINLKWSHFDDVLKIWLPGMQMEQKISSRLIHLECLSQFLAAAGLISVRWSPKLLNIIAEYSAEKNTCSKSLETLLVFIEVAWPRMKHHSGTIFIILMKVAMDLTELEDNSKSSNIIPLLKTCLNKLKDAAPDEVNKLCEEVSKCDELKSTYYSIFS